MDDDLEKAMNFAENSLTTMTRAAALQAAALTAQKFVGITPEWVIEVAKKYENYIETGE